jgi:hypothetical protein
MIISDHPWPGFTPDLLSIVLVTAPQAKGSVLIHQKMFESRLFFVDRLLEMGAQITLCDPHRALVIGSGPRATLRAVTMSSPDIRAGVALLIAAMSAEGTSTIHNIEQIDRGYQRIAERLNAIGANIEAGGLIHRTSRRHAQYDPAPGPAPHLHRQGAEPWWCADRRHRAGDRDGGSPRRHPATFTAAAARSSWSISGRAGAGPCRRENPNVVNAWRKYKELFYKNGDGFEVFSVSLDRPGQLAAWTGAIAKDSLQWKFHVATMEGTGNPAAERYGVVSIPTNVLIDGDGVIIATNLRGEALYEALNSITETDAARIAAMRKAREEAAQPKPAAKASKKAKKG